MDCFDCCVLFLCLFDLVWNLGLSGLRCILFCIMGLLVPEYFCVLDVCGVEFTVEFLLYVYVWC